MTAGGYASLTRSKTSALASSTQPLSATWNRTGWRRCGSGSRSWFDPAEDSVRLYRFCQDCGTKQEIYGIGTPTEEPAPKPKANGMSDKKHARPKVPF